MAELPVEPVFAPLVDAGDADDSAHRSLVRSALVFASTLIRQQAKAMIRALQLAARTCAAVAGRPKYAISAIGVVPRFISDAVRYQRLASGTRFAMGFWDLYPQLMDYHDQAGETVGHYVHQDLWAARKIWENKPDRHVDIGSRIDGFVTHLLSFRTVEVVDIRPLASSIDGLCFVQDDATRLERFDDGSLPSVSTLHAAEHFGLGRYGDPLDPNAPFLFFQALMRVLAPGGRLYFSTPVGRERVEFNAHRVFDPQTIIDAFDRLELVSFSAVNDDGAFVAEAQPAALRSCSYACGLFEFAKTDAGSFPSVA